MEESLDCDTSTHPTISTDPTGAQQMAKQVVHRAKMRITCDVEIPRHQKEGGVEVDLMVSVAASGWSNFAGWLKAETNRN